MRPVIRVGDREYNMRNLFLSTACTRFPAAVCLFALVSIFGTVSFFSTARAQGQPAAQPYAKHGDWDVEFVPGVHAGSPALCRVTKSFGTENALRIVSGTKLFAIDYMGYRSHALGQSYDVEYAMDNLDPTASVAQLVPDNDGVEWMRIEESTDEPGSSDALTNGDVLSSSRKAAGTNGSMRLREAMRP